MAEMKTLNGYEVVDAAARADIELLKAKEPDLSGYYTKSEVDAKDTAVQTNLDNHNHNNDYAPKVHNHDNEYAPKTHKHSYNDLTDKPTIPSTAGLASEAYVDAAIEAIPEPEKVDLTPYALKTDVPTTTNSKGLASEVYVQNFVSRAIADIDMPEQEGLVYVNISNRMTGAEVKAIVDAGKIPVYLGSQFYVGTFKKSAAASSQDDYYLFAEVSTTQDYPSTNEVPCINTIKCYFNRTHAWSELGTMYMLVTKQKLYEIEQRLAALEGGTN